MYGNASLGVVVAQDVREWQLEPCLKAGQPEPSTAEQCYQTCGFRSTEEVGKCLERPVSEGGFGDTVETTMTTVVDNVRTSGIQPGGTADLLAGFQAVQAGQNLEHSEGLYYCVYDPLTESDAFFWILNCEVIISNGPDKVLCSDLTPKEKELGAVGFVVDRQLLGDNKLYRYAVGSTRVLQTEVQPLNSSSLDCSSRPWFRSNTGSNCTDPLSVTCPTTFEGSSGVGSFQTYGSMGEGVVVAQDIRGWQLEPCLSIISGAQSDKDIGLAFTIGFFLSGALALMSA